MATTELNSFNKYPEFRTNNGINSVIQFIATGILPPNLTNRQANRVQDKFGAGSGFIVILIHGNQELFYNPNPQYDIEVVRPGNKNNRLQLIYDNIRKGLGQGLLNFYHQVAMSYLGILKRESDAWLKQHGDYQVSRVPVKHINRPIVVAEEGPNALWAIDLIDMSSYNAPGRNGNMRYIFHCVDYFSSKTFARAIPNRNNTTAPGTPGGTLANAFLNIINVDAGGLPPESVVVDAEFAMGSFLMTCAALHVVVRKTTSYTPESNGKIERFNRTLRKVMRAYFIRTNDIQWVNHLPDFVENINNQQQQSGRTANQLWAPGYNPKPAGYVIPPRFRLTDQMGPAQWRENQERHNVTKGERAVAPAAFNNRVYNVGDLVRVKFMKLNNRMREAYKTGFRWNNVAIHKSPLISSIHSVVPATNIRRQAYTIIDPFGAVIQQGAVPKLFFSSELIPVPNVNTPVSFPATFVRALYLNRLH